MSRTYVVTGSASGIGLAASTLLKGAGHTVIGVDRQHADVNIDLSTAEGRADLVTQVAELSGGRVDAVLAIAGLGHAIPATLSVNYFGAVATLEGLRPLLLESENPRAAVVSSAAALFTIDDELLRLTLAGDEAAALAYIPNVDPAPIETNSSRIYTTSKRAISLWVRAHASTPEWAGAGIALNAIAPGIVATPMAAAGLAIPEQLAAMEKDAPAPYNGPAARAEDLASALIYATSAENRFMTGQILYVDGGADSIRRPDQI